MKKEDGKAPQSGGGSATASTEDVCMTGLGTMSKSASPDVTLRQLLTGPALQRSPVFWDSDVAKSSSSPLSAQDLNSGSSQGDMPVSSTATFQWPGDTSTVSLQQHSSLSSQRSVDSTSGSGHNSLSEWTHFDHVLNNNHPLENDRHNILKELLIEEPGSDSSDNGAHALLKQILNDNKPNQENSKELRLLLDPLSVPSGSPPSGRSSDQTVGLSSSFMQNHGELTSNPSAKRKIEELDDSSPAKAPKLEEKNKMLAALLQSTHAQPDMALTVLPMPNPGDLPQSKLPKDLTSKLLLPPGQQMKGQMFKTCGNDFLDGDMFRSSDMNGDPMDSIFDLVNDLCQDSSIGGGDLELGASKMSLNEQQAIANIRQQLLNDFPASNGPTAPLMQQDGQHFREQALVSPAAAGPRYSMMQNPSAMVRAPLHAFPGPNDPNPSSNLMMQRLPSGQLILPSQVSPPSRPGIPSDFGTSRSPAPPTSAPPNSAYVKAQVRQYSWQRMKQAQQQSMNTAQMVQQSGPHQMAVGPGGANVPLQRSLSIPSPGSHGFAVNGFQNVPQSSPQFANQQSVPYSPPPQGNLRFSVQQSPNQPLSPRHPTGQPGSRLIRPNMWMTQQQQLSAMSGAPQSNNPMGQPNPGSYAGQQTYINQSNGQTFTVGPGGQILQQSVSNQPGMQRFQGGQTQTGQFGQQGMIQQDGAYGQGQQAYYARGVTPGMQQRMGGPGQGQQMMRTTFINNMPDEMRSGEGSFGNFQMNGTINSAPPTLNPQQNQFRWDLSSADRSNMSLPSTPGLASQNQTRMAAPSITLDPSNFQSFEQFYADEPSSNSSLNGLQQQQHHNFDQQFRPMYSNDQQQNMIMNQQFAPSSSGDVISQMGHSGNGPSLHQQLQQNSGDRKSLLQQLLSDNNG